MRVVVIKGSSKSSMPAERGGPIALSRTNARHSPNAATPTLGASAKSTTPGASSGALALALAVSRYPPLSGAASHPTQDVESAAFLFPFGQKSTFFR